MDSYAINNKIFQSFSFFLLKIIQFTATCNWSMVQYKYLQRVWWKRRDLQSSLMYACGNVGTFILLISSGGFGNSPISECEVYHLNVECWRRGWMVVEIHGMRLGPIWHVSPMTHQNNHIYWMCVKMTILTQSEKFLPSPKAQCVKLAVSKNTPFSYYKWMSLLGLGQ